ncbi:MAG: laccase domain-containing protein [Gammaproteobacteria bacterium]
MNLETSSYPNPRHLGHFRVAFSVIEDGNMERVQARREETTLNRSSFFRSKGVPTDRLIYRIRPSHSPNIEYITRTRDGLARRVFFGRHLIETDYDFYDQGADGILTTDPAPVLLISGDCAPVLLWETKSGLRGILHIGRSVERDRVHITTCIA